MSSDRDSELDPMALTVSASFGRRVELQIPDATPVQARPKGKNMRIVCGDRVVAKPMPNEKDWLVEEICSRINELARTDSRGRREVLAANIDAVFVVIAEAPEPDLFMVDRFLGAAHLMGCPATLISNKTDLGDSLSDLANDYRRLGYPVVETSAVEGNGMDALLQAIGNQRIVLVGQSGVGKSSLSNALAPDAQARIGELASSDEGRHTTVVAQLIDLPGGGALIDSPGVRDYAPHIDELRDVATAFPDISKHAGNCRFANCLHLAEPGCAVKEGVESGIISTHRYKSYRRLINITKELIEKSR